MERDSNLSQMFSIQLDPSFTSDITDSQIPPLACLDNVLDQDFLLPLESTKLDNNNLLNDLNFASDNLLGVGNNPISVPSLGPDINTTYILSAPPPAPVDCDLSDLCDFATEREDLSGNVQYDDINSSQDGLPQNIVAFIDKYTPIDDTPASTQSSIKENISKEKILNSLKENISNPIDNRVLQIQEQVQPAIKITVIQSDEHERPVKKKRVVKKLPPQSFTKPNPKTYIHISDTRIPARAIAVLPSVLQITSNEAKLYGNNISPKKTLPGSRRFGPVQGVEKKITLSEARKLMNEKNPVFFLNSKECGYVIHIDVSDTDKSNWMGLLPLGDQATANVWLYEEKGKLYGITTEIVYAKIPLRIGYSTEYFYDHKLPLGVPVLDLETVLANPSQWWCSDCIRPFPSSAALEHHIESCHKGTVIRYRRSVYRCTQCKRKFSRLFTMKRHLKQCKKKPEDVTETLQPDKNKYKEQDQQPLNSQDIRVPIDETFNISKGVNLSTKTLKEKPVDKIKPYTLKNRNENATNNCLSFSKEKSLPNKCDKESQIEPERCKYCKIVVLKENKRKHLSTCPSRILKCSCGLSFIHKKRFAQHIYKKHIEDGERRIVEEENKKDEKEPYKCEYCGVSFKRRGMLSNHTWRLHGLAPALSAERRERHFPCGECRNVYRTRDKRQRHVARHHPDVEKLRCESIEAGMKSYEPASCTACPRQYTARSKLLQHMRMQHPELAPAVKTVKPKTDNNIPRPTEKQKQTSHHNSSIINLTHEIRK